MIVPLQKTTAGGQRYTRLPETEATLAALNVLSDDDLVDLCGQAKSHPQYVPCECLLYFVRRSWSTDAALFERLFRILSERILRKLPRAENAGGETVSLTNTDIREAVFDRFIDLLVIDKAGYEERLDIFEVRFDLGMSSLRKDAKRKAYRAENRQSTVEVDEDWSELDSEVEAAAGVCDPFEASNFDDYRYRSRLDAAIDVLPELQRRIIEMTRLDIPVDSINPNEMTISVGQMSLLSIPFIACLRASAVLIRSGTSTWRICASGGAGRIAPQFRANGTAGSPR